MRWRFPSIVNHEILSFELYWCHQKVIGDNWTLYKVIVGTLTSLKRSRKMFRCIIENQKKQYRLNEIYRIQIFQPTKKSYSSTVNATIVSILCNLVRIGSFNVLYSSWYQNAFSFQFFRQRNSGYSLHNNKSFNKWNRSK